HWRRAEAGRDAAEPGVSALEGADLRPADEGGPGEHLLPAGHDLAGHGRVLRRQVNERNAAHRALPAGARSPRSSCRRIALTALKSSTGAVPRSFWYFRWILYLSRPAADRALSRARRAFGGGGAARAGRE